MLNREVEVFWVSRFDYDSHSNLELHRHSYYQIIYILHGHGKFRINDKWYEIFKQCLFFMNPGDEHSLSTDSSSKIKTLDIKFSLHPSLLKQTLESVPRYTILKDTEIARLLEKIRKEGMGKRAYFKDLSSLYLTEILLILLRQTENAEIQTDNEEAIITDEHVSAFEQIKAYIEDNFMRAINLEHISRALDYNKSYICQVFKKHANESIMAYLYRYRIRKASELLIYSDYSLKEVAAMVGFITVHHFNRRFHSTLAVTPGEFRERERNGIRKDILIDEGFSHEICVVDRDK